jgi:hypothetical protein
MWFSKAFLVDLVYHILLYLQHFDFNHFIGDFHNIILVILISYLLWHTHVQEHKKSFIHYAHKWTSDSHYISHVHVIHFTCARNTYRVRMIKVSCANVVNIRDVQPIFLMPPKYSNKEKNNYENKKDLVFFDSTVSSAIFRSLHNR